VKFNASGVEDAKGSLSPIVYGIMFKSTVQQDSQFALLHIQVQRTPKNVLVEFYSGFSSSVNPNITETVRFEQISETRPNIWSGTIYIPKEFIPSNPQLSAYSNFSQTSEHKTVVLTLQSSNHMENNTSEPNLFREEYFQALDLSQHLSGIDLTQWSQLWKSVINAGTYTTKPQASRPTMKSLQDINDMFNFGGTNPNQGFIEKGLISWIMISAVFCGILHVFVLSL